METCKDCATPITQTAGRGGRKVFCAACVVRRRVQAQRKWQAERYAALSPEDCAADAVARRERKLQQNYGISAAEFDALLAAQGGRCAICGTDPAGGKVWHVDHDHESGAVRGILCLGCNVGVGHFKDDPTLLRAAAHYLRPQTGDST